MLSQFSKHRQCLLGAVLASALLVGPAAAAPGSSGAVHFGGTVRASEPDPPPPDVDSPVPPLVLAERKLPPDETEILVQKVPIGLTTVVLTALHGEASLSVAGGPTECVVATTGETVSCTVDSSGMVKVLVDAGSHGAHYVIEVWD